MRCWSTMKPPRRFAAMRTLSGTQRTRISPHSFLFSMDIDDIHNFLNKAGVRSHDKVSVQAHRNYCLWVSSEHAVILALPDPIGANLWEIHFSTPAGNRTTVCNR